MKNATGVDASKFAQKVHLATWKSNLDKLDIDKLKNVSSKLSNLKSKVDKLDADNLVPVPVDLSKLSDVAKNDIVKKWYCINIEDKIPDITDLAHDTTVNAKINKFKNKLPSIINLGTTTGLSAKINEVKNKIPKITNLANATALTTFEIKICHVSSLVKKNDCNTNICEIGKKITTDHKHDKNITTQ